MNEILDIKPDDFDKIEAYYLNNAKLSPKQFEIVARYELAFSLLLQHRNKKVAVSKLIKITLAQGSKLAVAQAYRDIATSERIFIPIRKYSKELLRLTLLESAMRDAKEAEKRAKEASNIKDWRACMEIKNKAEFRIIQVSGITDFNADLPDFSKIQPVDIKINVPDEIFEIMKKITKSGVIDVTEMITANAEDAKIDENE